MLSRIDLPTAKTAELSPGTIPHWMQPFADDIRNYFAGNPIDFGNINLDWTGQTPFKQAVYLRVARIPWGETLSYGEVAAEVGSPKAARAVGQAMAGNPFPIVIPCHRVLAAHQKIGGFGGGVGLKRSMLLLEGINLI